MARKPCMRRRVPASLGARGLAACGKGHTVYRRSTAGCDRDVWRRGRERRQAIPDLSAAQAGQLDCARRRACRTGPQPEADPTLGRCRDSFRVQVRRVPDGRIRPLRVRMASGPRPDRILARAWAADPPGPPSRRIADEACTGGVVRAGPRMAAGYAPYAQRGLGGLHRAGTRRGLRSKANRIRSLSRDDVSGPLFPLGSSSAQTGFRHHRPSESLGRCGRQALRPARARHCS